MLGLAVVSCRDDDDKIKVGHHIEPLATIAGAANPMLEPYRSAGQKFHIAEIPLIAVTLKFIDADARHETFGKPLRRDDLAVVGHSTVEYELTTVPGIKNNVFGGDGLFLLRLTGPGKVWLQSLSLPMLAHALSPYLPQASAPQTPAQGLETVGIAAAVKEIAELL